MFSMRASVLKRLGRICSLYKQHLVEERPLILNLGKNPNIYRKLFCSSHANLSPFALRGFHTPSQAAAVDTHAYEGHTALEDREVDNLDLAGTYEDHEIQAASSVLRSYLQNTLHFDVSDAAAVVERAPSFVVRLVALAKQKKAGKEQGADEDSTSMLHKQVQALLHNADVNPIELILESIGMTSQQIKNLIEKSATECVDSQSLLSVIKTLEKLGFATSTIGRMLNKNMQALSYTTDEVMKGFQNLMGLNISADELKVLMQRFPLLLKPHFLNSVAMLDEDLSDLTSKGIIIRKVVLDYPKAVHSYSRGCAIEVVNFFKGYGFTISRINKLLQKCVRLVIADVDEHFKTKVRFFEGLGLSSELIAKVINRCPQIFFYSLPDNFMVKLEYFKSLGFDEAEFSGVIARYPQIFSCSLEKKIMPAVAELDALGLSGEGLKKVVLYRPNLFAFKLGGEISSIVKDLSEAQYPEDKKVTAFIKVCSRGSDHRRKCEECLVQHGLSAEQAKQVVDKEPGVLGYSKQGLNVKLEMLTKTFGIPIESVLTVPEFLSFALRKRIQRRQRVLSYMKSNGLLRCPLDIKQLVLHSNSQFYKDFVKEHGANEELSKIWLKDKSVELCSTERNPSNLVPWR